MARESWQAQGERVNQKKNKALIPAQGGIRAYLEDSRDLLTGLVLVLPLFVLYQLGVLMTDGLRNGVDFITSALWALTGGQVLYYVGVNLLVLLGFVVAIFALRKRGTLKPKIWPYMMLESLVYALFFGTAVVQMMSALGMGALLSMGAGGEMSLVQKFVMSFGAGLYEEIVFRLIGMGGVFLALRKFAKDLPSWVAALIAVVISSFIFSAIHHIGALGDPFTLGTFLFRFFAGVLLAVIFYLRGFAIAVYTHVLYDVIVMVFR